MSEKATPEGFSPPPEFTPPPALEELNLNKETPEMEAANQKMHELLTTHVPLFVEHGGELDVNRHPITNYSKLSRVVAEEVGGANLSEMLKSDPNAVYALGANVSRILEEATPYLKEYADQSSDEARNDIFGRRKQFETDFALEAVKHLQKGQE